MARTASVRSRLRFTPSRRVHLVRAYAYGSGYEVLTVPAKDGVTDLEAPASAGRRFCLAPMSSSPNFFGMMEDAVGEAVHPGRCQVHHGRRSLPLSGRAQEPASTAPIVAVGEGQPLSACPLLGRSLPGLHRLHHRDNRGTRPYRGRDHGRQGRSAPFACSPCRPASSRIRRQKASSNICSNQALCALTASVYLAEMGPVGLAGGQQCYAKAHYLASELCKIDGVEGAPGPFHEFLTTCPTPTRSLPHSRRRRDCP